MTRALALCVVVLASASTAMAEPASRLTELEWKHKLAVVLPGYPATTAVVVKVDATTLCTVTTSAGGELTLDATACPDLFDPTKVAAKAWTDNKVTATPAGGAATKLALVKPAAQVSGAMLADGDATLGDHVPGVYDVTRGGAALCTPITVGVDRKLALTAAACADLAKVTREDLLSRKVVASRRGPPSHSLTLGFFEPPLAAGEIAWDTIDTLPATDLVWFDPEARRWKRTDRDALKALRDKLALGLTTVVGAQGGNPVRWVLPRAPLTGTAGGEPADGTDYRAICRRRAREHRSSNVVCFRYQGGWQLLAAPSRGLVMRPNTTVLVVAFVPAGTRVSFDLAGETGIVAPTFEDPGFRANSTLGAPAPLAEVSQPFAPPVPGVHALTVALVTNPDDRGVIDLTVDTAYAGTIRLGVAGIFGGARDRTYGKATLPGSGQAEIVATGGGDLDVELVLGAAAFFERGGRTYVADTPRRWAPYFGIGLLNQGATGLELLKSAHLGLELELARNFSIAFTVVGRRVTRLADGLEVGDPIDSATVPTRTGYELGTAIVVNVSPEFFKLARSPSGGFFQ